MWVNTLIPCFFALAVATAWMSWTFSSPVSFFTLALWCGILFAMRLRAFILVILMALLPLQGYSAVAMTMADGTGHVSHQDQNQHTGNSAPHQHCQHSMDGNQPCGCEEGDGAPFGDGGCCHHCSMALVEHVQMVPDFFPARKTSTLAETFSSFLPEQPQRPPLVSIL